MQNKVLYKTPLRIQERGLWVHNPLLVELKPRVETSEKAARL